MQYKITKELFETVYVEPHELLCVTYHDIRIDDRYIHYKYQDPNATCSEEYIELNDKLAINDFFFKCKEWAGSKGYKLKSSNLLCNILEKI